MRNFINKRNLIKSVFFITILLFNQTAYSVSDGVLSVLVGEQNNFNNNWQTICCKSDGAKGYRPFVSKDNKCEWEIDNRRRMINTTASGSAVWEVLCPDAKDKGKEIGPCTCVPKVKQPSDMPRGSTMHGAPGGHVESSVLREYNKSASTIPEGGPIFTNISRVTCTKVKKDKNGKLALFSDFSKYPDGKFANGDLWWKDKVKKEELGWPDKGCNHFRLRKSDE